MSKNNNIASDVLMKFTIFLGEVAGMSLSAGQTEAEYKKLLIKLRAELDRRIEDE